MAEVWTNYLWPLIVMVAQSVLLLVVLLIITAYVLYADRKIWAAVQIRRGPNVVGPWGLLQSFADLLKFMVKEPVIPSIGSSTTPTWSCICGSTPSNKTPRSCLRHQRYVSLSPWLDSGSGVMDCRTSALNKGLGRP